MALPAAAGERSAERRLPDDPGVAPTLPGASPETMASAVATPLEQQFSTIAGIDSMTSTSALGVDADHHPVHARPRTSTPPRRTCRRRSPRRAPLLPPGMPTPPSLPEGEPGRPADPLPGAQLADAAALRRSTSTRRPASPSASRRSAASRRCRCSARRSTRCACRSIRARSPRAASASTRSRRPSPARNVNLPTGTLYGAHQAFTVQATGQLTDAAAFRPLDRRLPQRRAGAARGARARDRQRADRQGRQLVQRRARGRPGRSSASPARTPSRSSTRSRRCCRRSAQQLPASVEPRRPLRPLGGRSASRSTTCSSRCCSRIALVVLVIFLFLRNVSATIIPSLARAAVDHRHLRA